MRNGPGFVLALSLTMALCAQTRSVVNPAGAGLPGVTRTLGSVVNPAQGGLVVPGSRGGNAIRGRVIAAYPIYMGGYYYPYVASVDPSAAAVDPSAVPPQAAPASTNVTVVMPPQQPVTPVVINYNYGTPPPAAPDQTAASRAPAPAADESDSAPSHYLIAFKDHTIYAATAYWVDGDTLHYFTSGNVHNQVSLSLVDREFTERLNKEAGLDVRLPAPSK